MSIEAWATIIAALIGVVGTLLVTKFDSLTEWFHGSVPSIAGNWEITSYKVNLEDNATEKRSWAGEYVVNLKQSGRKVKGVMTATKVTPNFKPYTYSWKGEVKGEYLIYECVGSESSQSMLSTALMYMHDTGDRLSGYFVVKSGHDEPEPTWVGFAEMKKRK